jgi:putative ABC transport system permease protein
MFQNYLKTTLRNLSRRKAYTALNILGLVIGMTCCLFIFHYVSYEKSYDGFQPFSNQLVRVRLDIFQNGRPQLESATVYPAIARAMKKDFSEVYDVCRLHTVGLDLASDKTKTTFNEKKGFYADPSFLKMFDVKMINPAAGNYLGEPYQLLLSETMSKKYFGMENPVGQKLIVRTPAVEQAYLVTGVFKDYPLNSHLAFDYLVSYSSYDKTLQIYGYPALFTEDSWDFRDFYTYVQLKENVDLRDLQAKMPAFCDRYINSGNERTRNNTRDELHLIPVKNIHLYSNSFNEAGINGNGRTVSFLLIIATFIIGIAWINYINLTTARSVERAKETGVRKLLGAKRYDLVRQFIGEGLLLNSTALLISLSLFIIFKDEFNAFTGKSQPADFFLSTDFGIFFGALFFAGTIVSALYPSFVLSAFKPVIVLKGSFKHNPGGILLRKTLLSVQFIISIILIAATIIVYRQMQFMSSQPIGANIDQTVVIQGATSMGDSVYRNSFNAFKNDLLRLSGIRQASVSTSVMGREIAWTRNVRRIDIPGAAAAPLYHVGIDYDFVDNYDIPLLAGRNFSKQFGTDEKTVLINEEAARILGFTDAQEAIDKTVIRSADTVKIVGVTADFHQQTLKKKIEPIIFLLMPNARNFYSVKIENADIHSTVTAIATTWKKYFPDDPFNYFFLDESFHEQYKSDYLFQKVFTLFALLAIFIAGFGLLGLTAYNIAERSREISVRKILGANISSIGVLLTKDFMRVILFAFLVAIPLTHFIMSRWLENFAYKKVIDWWIYGLAGAMAFLVAGITVFYHVFKAASANPVKNLRNQ